MTKPLARSKTLLSAVAACCLGCSVADAQLVSDCTVAPNVGVGTYTFDTTDTFQDPLLPMGCGGFVLFNQYIRFVPPVPGTYFVSFSTLSSDARLSSFNACPTEFFESSLDCVSTESCGVSGAVLRVNGPTLLVVSGVGITPAIGAITIAAAPAPAPFDGDVCERARPATLGTNAFDTSNSSENNFVFYDLNAQDQWYVFTPAVSGNLVAALCNPGSSLQLYSGCTELQVIDDLTCTTATYAAAGVPIYARVIGLCNTSGDFTLTLTPSSRPANDICGSALAVSLGVTQYDNTFAATDGSDPCPGGFGAAGKELYFAFTPAITSQYLLTSLGEITIPSPTGLMEYPGFVVYDSCNGIPLACVSTGFQTIDTRVFLTAGLTYYIQVGGLGLFDLPPYRTHSRGAGAFTLSRIVVPTNDQCANAAAVGEGTFSFNILGATNDGLGNCAAQGTSIGDFPDVWYLYTPTVTGNIEIGTVPGTNGQLNGQSSELSVRNGCSGGDLRVAYVANDDFGLNYARLPYTVATGQPVLIRIASSFPDSVSQQGTLYIGAPRLPAYASNDECTGATSISSGSFAYDFTGSNTDLCRSFIDCDNPCNSIYGQDLFYAFTPTVSGSATIACESIGGSIVSVITSCSASSNACNFADCSGLFEPSFTVAVNAGQTYMIRVSSYSAADGVLTLSLPGACIADFNGSGSATVQDIFDFLSAYFSNSLTADINNSGTISVQDIFDFLSFYFSGC